MYKDATYKKKFADLKEWIPSIVETIKKDLRNEHLKNDVYFVKKFLASKNIHKLTTEELAEAYEKAVQDEEQGEQLAEFMTSRWLLKNSELYDFFEKQLSQINPDFASLEEMTKEQARSLIDASNAQYGAPRTYVFSVLNSVVFPEESYETLKRQAKEQKTKQEEVSQFAVEQNNIEQMRGDFEREIARLTDKYEKKLAGLQKKYLVDVEALKKQIAALQRKMHQEKAR